MAIDQLHDAPEMTFLDHIEALRWHLIRAAGAIVALAIIAFFFKDFIFDGIFLGPAKTSFWTYRILCQYFPESLCVHDIGFKLINTEMSGQFSMHIMTSMTTGVVLGFPYLLFELWSFIKPALSLNEQKFSRGIAFYATLLFAIGLVFGYYFVTPTSIQFLGSYRVSDQVENLINMESYLDSVVMLSFCSALVFELPMVIYFLSKAGIITPQLMRKFRKHAVLVILIISAVITPGTDITSQMVLAIPFMILYEVSILVSARVNTRRLKRMAALDAE